MCHFHSSYLICLNKALLTLLKQFTVGSAHSITGERRLHKTSSFAKLEVPSTDSSVFTHILKLKVPSKDCSVFTHISPKKQHHRLARHSHTPTIALPNIHFTDLPEAFSASTHPESPQSTSISHPATNYVYYDYHGYHRHTFIEFYQSIPLPRPQPRIAQQDL